MQASQVFPIIAAYQASRDDVNLIQLDPLEEEIDASSVVSFADSSFVGHRGGGLS